jgi:16S rRNA C967 or C1407 C5-methylase (RsmB/RsmF family)
LMRHPEFVIDKDINGLPESVRVLMDTEGFLRTMPHRHHMDGFFSVRFRRIS